MSAIESLIQVVTSWEFVCFVAAAPLALLLLNFMFGECSVAASIETNRASSSLRSKRIGRVTVTAIAACLVWQFIEYTIAFRWWQQRDILECNPAVLLFALVDWCSSRLVGVDSELFDAATAASLRCTYCDVVYYMLSFAFCTAWVECVLSTPQLSQGNAKSSKCSKCNAHVEGMDHHCYFIHNCVGSANRGRYLMMMSSCCLLCMFLGWQCYEFVLSSRSWADILALAFTCVCGVGSLLLALLQVLLIRRGLTTIGVLKAHREEKSKLSVICFFVRTLFWDGLV